MIVLLLTLACAPAAALEEPHAELLESWRESIVFDQPGEVLGAEASVLKEFPELRMDGEALDLRVRARLANEDPESARKLIDDTQLAADEARFGTLARARVALFEDQLGEVIRLLKDEKTIEVATEYESLVDAWLLLGRAHARSGKNVEAAGLLHQFIRRAPLHPEAPSAWHFLAQHANRMQQSARAHEYLQAAEQTSKWHAFYRARRIQVRENPEAILPRLGLVILWMQAKQPQSAKDEIARILAIDPNQCDALGHLAEAERLLGSLDAAKAAYDRALQCAPGAAGLRFNRAYLASLQGRTANARVDYEWIVASEHESDKRFIAAHLELARIHSALENQAATDLHYQRYVELGGKEPLAK